MKYPMAGMSFNFCQVKSPWPHLYTLGKAVYGFRWSLPAEYSGSYKRLRVHNIKISLVIKISPPNRKTELPECAAVTPLCLKGYSREGTSSQVSVSSLYIWALKIRVELYFFLAEMELTFFVPRIVVLVLFRSSQCDNLAHIYIWHGTRWRSNQNVSGSR